MKNMAFSVVSALSLLVLAGAAAAQDEVRLTLPEALQSGIERNLDIRAELYSPAMAEANLRKFQGVYEPHFAAETNFTYTKLPSSFEDQEVSGSSKQAVFNVGIYSIIPTGARVEGGFENLWGRGSEGPSAWGSDLYLRLSQPLLKNLGRDATEINIRLAEKEKEGTISRLRGKLLNLTEQISNEYYNLHSLRQDLEVKRASLALAQKVLEETRARVKAGVTPAMETLNAEYGVASREKEVIDAEKAVKNQGDLLRLLLQIDDAGEIVPADVPPKDSFAPNLEADINRAQRQNPDIEELRAEVAANEISSKHLRNLTLPDLYLDGLIRTNGAGQHYDTNLERMSSGKYPTWNVGLRLDVPLGNSAAKNDYIRSKLKTEQLKAQLRSKEESVAKEVKTSGRAVTSAYKQLEVADRQRAFAEERLRAFMKKSEVGLATIREVLEVENELTLARSAQIKAQVDYSNAVTNYLKTTGDLLDAAKIRISAGESDKLYRQANN